MSIQLALSVLALLLAVVLGWFCCCVLRCLFAPFLRTSHAFYTKDD